MHSRRHRGLGIVRNLVQREWRKERGFKVRIDGRDKEAEAQGGGHHMVAAKGNLSCLLPNKAACRVSRRPTLPYSSVLYNHSSIHMKVTLVLLCKIYSQRYS